MFGDLGDLLGHAYALDDPGLMQQETGTTRGCRQPPASLGPVQ
jgi:hypothetical protein